MSNLEAYSDPPTRMLRETCECGQFRARGLAACKGCSFLDGNKNGALVIAALRTVNGLTLNEICDAVHGKHEQAQRTPMLRTMQHLMRNKRVARRYEEREQMGVTSTFSGKGGPGGSWVYVLGERA